MFGSDLKVINRTSKHKINTSGEIGSPCLVDLSILKLSEMWPLLEMQVLPQL